MDKITLYNYFANKATLEEEVAILEWIQHSEANKKEFLSERKIWDAFILNFDSEPVIVEKSIVHSGFDFWRWGLRIANIAAVFAILIFVTFEIAERKSSILSEAKQTVIVPVGQRVNLLLADGTSVWLNSNTTFTYPTGFNHKTRDVQINGEGYFKVAKDVKHPFIVHTNKYNLEVLGTTFNVYAYEGSKNFETSLFEGSVKVMKPKDATQNLTLKPNEKVFSENEQLYKVPIYSSDESNWQGGIICFNDEPIERVIQKLEMYFNQKIKIENSAILGYRCTAKFLESEGVSYILKIIQKDLKYKIVIDNQTQTIFLK